MGIKEEEEMQANGIENRFNKIIAENLPNFEKEMLIQLQEPLGLQTKKIKTEPLHGILQLEHNTMF
jgi:hypothetical protein